jgi:LysW-gamma-L-lysine carboxypeptidase
MDSLELLRGLLEHYSPTGQEAGAVTYLVEAMHASGYQASLDGAGNAVGVLGEGSNEVMLLGHIDTIPGNIEIRQQGDILYGRGAVDAKGPLACFVMASSQVKVPAGWRLTVIGAVGEEGDSRGARYVRDFRSRPRMVVIGEPSGWDRLTLGYKGSLKLSYSVRQSLAHSAAQTSGACETAFRFWMDLLQLAEEYNQAAERSFSQLTPSLREMSSAEDGFFQTARLQIGVRLPPGDGIDSLLEQLRGLAGDADLEIQDYIPPYRSEKNNVLVRSLLAAIREAGGEPGFTLKTGTSDMNLVGPAWDCPILAYGPGDSRLDHTPEENISLSEYQKSIQVLAQTLSRVMQA